MGYFDGMENQAELEYYFKKFVSALISLSDDLLEGESDTRDEQEAVGGEEENLVAKYPKPAKERI